MEDKNTLSVPVSEVEPFPGQPRKEFDQEKLESLAQSIKSKGLIQPIIVKEGLRGYMIIDGERRWRAHKIAGLTEIDVVVNNNVGIEDHHLVSLIANFNREGHSPMETSNALAKERRGGKSVEELADAIGKSAAYIYQHLALQNLHPQLKELVGSENKKNVLRLQIAIELSKVEKGMQLSVYEDCKNKASAAAKLRYIKKHQNTEGEKATNVVRFRPAEEARSLTNLAGRTADGIEKFMEMPKSHFEMVLESMTQKQKAFMVNQLKEAAASLEELAVSVDNWSG